jgi:hypothetical protein
VRCEVNLFPFFFVFSLLSCFRAYVLERSDALKKRGPGRDSQVQIRGASAQRLNRFFFVPFAFFRAFPPPLDA